MKRHGELLIQEHFSQNRQMLFLCGPRQVGKTTCAQTALPKALYLNWDIEDDRNTILSGQNSVVERMGTKPSVIFDEIHKYPEWKNFLKGFFDSTSTDPIHILVTRSARLNTYRKGADSLMGRYLLQRLHPLSVAELIRPRLLEAEYTAPAPINSTLFSNLLDYGGFPEPLLKANRRFSNQWKKIRRTQLFREEIRDLFNVHEIGQVEVLAELLRMQSGQLTNRAALARKLRAAENSVSNWISLLEKVYYSFPVRPWSKNISRSLLKEPKIFLWDWSLISDVGARNENFIASHLLKAVHAWTDAGLGDYGLHYLRTKDQREVDFLVTRDDSPWLMVEVKTSQERLSPHLKYFYERMDVQHAFQIVMNKKYEEVDLFNMNRPVVVSAQTFLSQLV